MISNPSPPTFPEGGGRKRAFTVIEMVVAFAIMGAALIFVSKVAYSSLKERTRGLARQTALEHANNILELARAQPWEKLTPEWAAALKLPEEWKYAVPEGTLNVRVEPETGVPNLKRVSVRIRWRNVEGYPVDVQLIGLFAARSAAAEEKK